MKGDSIQKRFVTIELLNCNLLEVHCKILFGIQWCAIWKNYELRGIGHLEKFGSICLEIIVYNATMKYNISSFKDLHK